MVLRDINRHQAASWRALVGNKGPKRNKALDYSTALPSRSTTLGRLPARTCSESYAYATRANAYSDARAWIVVAAVITAIVVSTAFHIPRSVVFLNNYAGRTSFSPATSIIITNHSDSFDAVVGNSC